MKIQNRQSFAFRRFMLGLFNFNALYFTPGTIDCSAICLFIGSYFEVISLFTLELAFRTGQCIFFITCYFFIFTILFAWIVNLIARFTCYIRPRKVCFAFWCWADSCDFRRLAFCCSFKYFWIISKNNIVILRIRSYLKLIFGSRFKFWNLKLCALCWL